MRSTSHSAALRLISAAFAIALIAVSPGFSQTPKSEKKAGADHELNAQFANPDVKSFVQRFESDNREVYSRRAEIVKALNLKKGMNVADVGAGTGLFTRPFADQVGKEGIVYAVDVSPAFLQHIMAESRKLGQTQVHVVRASQESTGLDPRSIDVAFLCDVYHHLEYPTRTLDSIYEALRPGGVLVVIDFDRVKGKSSEFVLKHVRAEKSVFVEEIRAAGFAPVRTPNPDAPVLKENFFMSFVRLDSKPKRPAPRPLPPKTTKP